jgi:para-nitrobenzyl esterase
MSQRLKRNKENVRERLEHSFYLPCLRKAGSTRQFAMLLSCCAALAGLGLVLSPASRAQESTGPVVTVTGGEVQGRRLPAPGGAVFKGIPYAAPPTASLRWREPQPVRPWTGVRQAGEYGAACPQANTGSETERITSEDCLFLNVWTPEWPSRTNKVVMVWLHGGELRGGSGALRSGPAENAESTLARRGVVLVSINYRPNLLGMMGHPELTAESPHHASGNYVILDAIAALKWVHENIARFGGDPGNVTVFGQSGGAHVTSFLVTSPLAKGLIHRAIAESGAVAQFNRPVLTLKQLEQMGTVAAQVLKAPSTGSIKYLKGLPASNVAAVTDEVRQRLLEMNFQPDDEGIDGYSIPESPPEVYRSHKESPVPMIIGSTGVDTGTMIASSLLRRDATPEEVQVWVKHVLEMFYGKYPDLLARAEKIYGLRGTPNEVSTYPPYGTIRDQLGVDINHRCGVQATALWHSSIAPTYTYEFTRSSHGPAVHTAELRFVFGYLSKEELSDPTAHKMADILQQYWTNFAKNGDPNGPGLPVWSKYGAATKQSIEVTDDAAVPRTGSRAVACGPFIERLNRDPKPLQFDNGRQELRPNGTERSLNARRK